MKRFILSLSLLGACAGDQANLPSETEDLPASVQDEVERLTGELADVPGDLVITRSTEFPFSDELRARVQTAGKVIHIYKNNTVAAYVGAEIPVPADVPAQRRFHQLGGDIVIGDQARLPAFLGEQEAGQLGVPYSVGLPTTHNELWPDSTVAFTLDGALTGTEIAAINDAVTAWNASTDASGVQNRVRFIPRYPGDNRPYVSFVRGGGGCGSSQVGRHDWLFSNWWSHNININCFDRRTIQHEMGHTAGLYHEQQRCDRASFVNMGVTSGVDCEARCDPNNARTYGVYNYLSVMHYGYSADPAACSISQRTAGGPARGQPWQAGTAWQLDTDDVSAINQMYSARPALPQIGAGRFYHIVPAHASWKAIIAGGGIATPGSQLIQWDRFPGWTDQHVLITNQPNGLVRIQMRHDNLCFAIAGGSTSNGAVLQQTTCFANSPSQQWILAPTANQPGSFDIINRNSNKSLDVPGSSTANGSGIQQYDHNSNANQRFLLLPAT